MKRVASILLAVLMMAWCCPGLAEETGSATCVTVALRDLNRPLLTLLGAPAETLDTLEELMSSVELGFVSQPDAAGVVLTVKDALIDVISFAGAEEGLLLSSDLLGQPVLLRDGAHARQTVKRLLTHFGDELGIDVEEIAPALSALEQAAEETGEALYALEVPDVSALDALLADWAERTEERALTESPADCDQAYLERRLTITAEEASAFISGLPLAFLEQEAVAAWLAGLGLDAAALREELAETSLFAGDIELVWHIAQNTMSVMSFSDSRLVRLLINTQVSNGYESVPLLVKYTCFDGVDSWLADLGGNVLLRCDSDENSLHLRVSVHEEDEPPVSFGLEAWGGTVDESTTAVTVTAQVLGQDLVTMELLTHTSAEPVYTPNVPCADLAAMADAELDSWRRQVAVSAMETAMTVLVQLPEAMMESIGEMLW